VGTTFRSSGNADTFALELTQVERQGAPSEAGARQPASLLCKAAAGTTGSPKHRRGELFSGSQERTNGDQPGLEPMFSGSSEHAPGTKRESEPGTPWVIMKLPPHPARGTA
jgi:hypothetical protein